MALPPISQVTVANETDILPWLVFLDNWRVVVAEVLEEFSATSLRTLVWAKTSY
jgi:hypothetical protein